MKKLIVIALVFALVCGFVFANGATEAKADTLESKVEKGQKLSDAELLELAKAETGDFYAYGNSSRVANAMKLFVAKYGAELGLTESNAVGTKMNDADIYTNIAQEATGGSGKVASVVMIQDGAQLVMYRSATDYFLNYIPGALKGVISDADQVPLVHQYINKLFIWNTLGSNAPVITNVWQLTEPALKDRIFFKNPTTEQVNNNFLIMCTSDAWAQKLADAYKAYTGKAIELGSYKNAGYKWVAEFLANVNFSVNSDTTICNTIASAESAGSMGLFVLSKTRDLDASLKANLQVGAFTQAQINPFSGFMYPLYVQMTRAANRPYTAMLFINYLMTSEGFAPWGGAGTSILGAYSTNPAIGAAEGDQAIDFWKNCLVAEDAAYIMQNRTTVTDFINAEIAKK
jgi:iron(III) transport system substrate-binding protein